MLRKPKIPQFKHARHPAQPRKTACSPTYSSSARPDRGPQQWRKGKGAAHRTPGKDGRKEREKTAAGNGTATLTSRIKMPGSHHRRRGKDIMA
eukprot:6593925-Heterocapsa_arctica.AAC.1